MAYENFEPLLDKDELKEFMDIAIIMNRASVNTLIDYLLTCEDYSDFRRDAIDRTGLSNSLMSQDIKRLKSIGIIETYNSSYNSFKVVSLNYHRYEKLVNSIRYILNIKVPKGDKEDA